jgi:hypothetical protein
MAASWRYLNSGAQYPGPIANKWGSTGHGIIGGGHKIARFDDPLNGAAAHFDLLGQRYAGMTINDAIKKWSGGNSWQPYASRVAQEVGVDPNERLTIDRIRDPNFAVPFAKAMAKWEAGKPFPMSDAQWSQAHRMYLGAGGAINRAQNVPREPEQTGPAEANAFSKPENDVYGFGRSQAPDEKSPNAFAKWGSDHYGQFVDWSGGSKNYV